MPTCQVSWMENGELVNDGKPAVILAHLHYRQNAPRLTLAPVIYMCQEHYDQFSSREAFHNPQFQAREGITRDALYSYFDDFQEALHITYSALPIQITISPGSFTLPPGGTQLFTATVTGNPNTAVFWSAAQGSIVSTGPNTGLYTAPSITTGTVDTITARSAADRCSSVSVQVSIAAEIAITVVVSPQTATLTAGPGQTVPFSAVVNGITNQNVSWSAAAGGLGQVNQPPVGQVSASGVYTAPAALAVQSFDNVIASSVGDPDTFGLATVTINPNVMVTISPGSASVIVNAQQQFTATVAGITDQTVIWQAQFGSIDSTGLYTAPASAVTDKITATSASFRSALAQIPVTVTTGTGVSVTVTPVNGILNPGQTLQFTAVVNGLTNQAVTWSLQFFNAPPKGSISSSGLYTAPASNQSATAVDQIAATSVADPAAVGIASVNINIGGPAQLDLVQWMIMSNRTSQHLVGDANAPYSAQIIDTDPLYPANYPKNCVWQIKNRLGNPWDVHTYDQNHITHWITEDGDAVDQAACQAANGTSCWLYSHAYKRYLTPVAVLPRFFNSGASVTLDTLGPNTNYATTNCESSSPRVITIGDVRGITTGPFKISWGGSIDHGTGTGATAPNYDSVNGVNTIKVQYCYSGTIASGTFQDIEEYYFVLGFGQVGWYYYHGGVFQNKTVNNTLAAAGCPAPNFPCGPGKSWFA